MLSPTEFSYCPVLSKCSIGYELGLQHDAKMKLFSANKYSEIISMTSGSIYIYIYIGPIYKTEP